ncbi:MAG: FAD/NAD(P)-binding protein [Candidatus Saelkia tenebricola]|nr:FAD/NAD(P)-binding protein [Candidatus Saelkia tenebricola]
MKSETYKITNAVVEDIITETSNIKTFVLKPDKGLEFKTGQFVELAVKGLGEAPFTPSSDPGISEKIDMTIMKVGLVTDAMHNMKKGEILGIRGPYGQGYPIDDFKGKRVCVIGGGVGLAPLRSLLYELMHDLSRFEKVSLYYGAKTPKDIVYKNYVKKLQQEKELDLFLTVDQADDSWTGNVGVVTTILEDLNPENSIACVCGPPIMMKFSTLKLLEIGFKEEDIYLSMEKNMSCGVGKCGHCRIGNYYACKDGPVFTYAQIKNFDEIWD